MRGLAFRKRLSFFRARKEDDVDETYESGFYPVLPRWNLYLVVSINMQ